jgi:DNA-binding transcriptional LysR family regulator
MSTRSTWLIAGEVVVRFVQGRTRELHRLQASIDALKNLQKGHVSIFTVEGTIGWLLPQALAEFSQAYPGVTYEVHVAGTDGVMEAVAEDRCDIGISFHPSPRRDVEPVASIIQPLLAVMSPSHRLARCSSLSLTGLADEPLALPNATFGIRHLVTSPLGLHRQLAQVMQHRIETCLAHAHGGGPPCDLCTDRPGCQIQANGPEEGRCS